MNRFKSISFFTLSSKPDRVLLFLYSVYFFIFAFASTYTFISHSEFWAIASAKLLGSNSPQAVSLYYKTFFYALLKPIYWLPISNSEHILSARLMFGVIAFFNFHLFLKNIYLMTRSHFAVFFFSLFLLSMQIYFYNSFRVRADIVASLFLLLAYTKINQSFLRKETRSNKSILVFFLLAFLSTPKAIYLIIGLLAYHYSLNYKKQTLYSFSKPIALYLLIPISLLIFVTSALQNFELITESPYVLALNYHYNSFLQTTFKSSWMHVITSLKINFIHFGLIFIGFTLYLNKYKKNDHPLLEKQMFLFLWVILIVCLHPEKWPYFIAQLIPFLSLPVIFILPYLRKKTVRLVTVLLTLISPFLITNTTSWLRPNYKQITTINRIDRIYNKIGADSYFDSTGLLPRENGLMSFIGPNDPNSLYWTLENIKNEEPSLIIYTPKLQRAEPEILQILYFRYQKLGPDLWIKKGHKADLAPNEIKDLLLQNLFIFDYHPHIKSLF